MVVGSCLPATLSSLSFLCVLPEFNLLVECENHGVSEGPLPTGSFGFIPR